MSTRTTIAKVSSLDFQVADITPLGEGGSVIRGGYTVASISGGLLSYIPAMCSVIPIANGTTINAIRAMYRDGSVYTDTDIEADQGETAFRPLLLRAADGGSFTVVHDAVPPGAEWEDYERLACQYGADIEIGNAWLYLQWEKVGGSRRWRAPDWSAYMVGVPSDWDGSPTRLTIWEALDELAARSVIVASGSVAITSGVPVTLWSRTVAEGEVVGGRLELTAGFYSGGSTLRSRGTVDFGASRDVGGSTASTQNGSPVENGTLTGGTLAVSVVGNDVVVQATYSETGTLHYKTRVHLDAIDVPQV